MLHFNVESALLVAPTEEATTLLDFEVTGVFQTFSKDCDARIIKISLLAARELLSTRGANTLVVSLRETGHAGRVAKSLTREFAQDRLELKNWEQLNDFYEKAVDLYDRLFGVLRLIVLLLMMMLSVLNAVSVSVLERAGEFGTMRALGNRNRDVFKFVVLEGVVLGLIGALIGTLLGIALAWAISAAGISMPPPNSNVGYTAEIRMEPLVILGAFLVGVFASVLASLVSGISRFPDSGRRSPAPHRLAVSRFMPKKVRILIDSAVVERRPLYKVVVRG